MQDYYTPKGKQLTIHERKQIQRWKLEGRSNREIARLLGKAPQTIHNEIKRGLVRQQVRKGKFEAVYSAQHAQLSIKKIASVLLDPLDSVSKIGRLLNTTCVRTIPLR